MIENDLWYICDPEKNTECEKTRCAYNPDARFRVCTRTNRPEFARLDFAGQPCKDYAENSRVKRVLRAILSNQPRPHI